jgi:hypothetical protein
MVKEDIYIGMPVTTRHGKGTVEGYDDNFGVFMVRLEDGTLSVSGCFHPSELSPDRYVIRDEKIKSIMAEGDHAPCATI